MRKILISLAIVCSLGASFEWGLSVNDSSYTERIVARVTSLDDGNGYMEVKNIVSSSDVVAIDKIQGAHLGDRVQVNFDGDAVTKTKLLKGDN